jgi:lantibiotic modifying enzyme
MEYDIFCGILNKQIFESSKRDLIEKISNYPDRYIGLFRPTKPRAKILQNLLSRKFVMTTIQQRNVVKLVILKRKLTLS